jgi:hypothetical protein
MACFIVWRFPALDLWGRQDGRSDPTDPPSFGDVSFEPDRSKEVNFGRAGRRLR